MAHAAAIDAAAGLPPVPLLARCVDGWTGREYGSLGEAVGEGCAAVAGVPWSAILLGQWLTSPYARPPGQTRPMLPSLPVLLGPLELRAVIDALQRVRTSSAGRPCAAEVHGTVDELQARLRSVCDELEAAAAGTGGAAEAAVAAPPPPAAVRAVHDALPAFLAERVYAAADGALHGARVGASLPHESLTQTYDRLGQHALPQLRVALAALVTHAQPTAALAAATLANKMGALLLTLRHAEQAAARDEDPDPGDASVAALFVPQLASTVLQYGLQLCSLVTRHAMVMDGRELSCLVLAGPYPVPPLQRPTRNLAPLFAVAAAAAAAAASAPRAMGGDDDTEWSDEGGEEEEMDDTESEESDGGSGSSSASAASPPTAPTRAAAHGERATALVHSDSGDDEVAMQPETDEAGANTETDFLRVALGPTDLVNILPQQVRALIEAHLRDVPASVASVLDQLVGYMQQAGAEGQLPPSDDDTTHAD